MASWVGDRAGGQRENGASRASLDGDVLTSSSQMKVEYVTGRVARVQGLVLASSMCRGGVLTRWHGRSGLLRSKHLVIMITSKLGSKSNWPRIKQGGME